MALRIRVFMRTCLVFTASLLSQRLQALQDKKLKGQLTVREELYGKSAQAAAKTEKVNFCLV